MKKPDRLYVVWPKKRQILHPDAFTTRKAAEDCALEDEEVVVYVLHEDHTRQGKNK